ncbi:MAG: hypothetical protein HW380_48 [Magnetococcales bacterium]|nr:hypothetical protein [Magnetococcales bacterium]HIJ82708.1 glycosyltransferase [Magnetococcales bacterium]
MSPLHPIFLNILGRTPESGKVKTRLIPLLGAEGATKAHESLLTHVVHTGLTWCLGAGNRNILLWCTPDTRHPFFDGLLPHNQRRLQPDGDLGVRLNHIAVSQLVNNQHVILLGGDAASITVKILDQTQAALRHHDAIMAPTEDGGYALLALSRYHAGLFQKISWGTASVAEETRKFFSAMGWQWKELPMQWDVDRPQDWQRFEKLRLKHPSRRL